MDDWMDNLWDHIVDLFVHIAALLDLLLAPLNERLGPAVTILTIIVALVALTKLLGRLYNTKRYLELKKNYEHWYALRSEAMACEDREKGKTLARNIDQAQLNKAYYDYFFEGFLKSIATAILPILFTAAYVNHAYGPDKLMQLIGQKGPFRIPAPGQRSHCYQCLFLVCDLPRPGACRLVCAVRCGQKAAAFPRRWNGSGHETVAPEPI